MGLLSSNVTLGNNEVALTPNTVLALIAVLLAAMQGLLSMESASPCRISYKKLRVLLMLIALEAVVVVTAESLSFVYMRAPLKERLTWLQWVPPCLLVLGLVELLLDILYTVDMAAGSRVYWLPFSSVGDTHNINPFQFYLRFLIEVVPGLLTVGLTVIMVGWRQNWWLNASSMETAVAKAATIKSLALTRDSIAVCFAFGFFFTISVLVSLVQCGSQIQFNRWKIRRYMFDPRVCWRTYPTNASAPESESQTKVLYKMLYKMQYGESEFETVSEDEMKICTRTAPLCIGNAIVGGMPNLHRFHRSLMLNFNFRNSHLMFMFAQYFGILPLQICVLVGLLQIHDKMDVETFRSVGALVDAVIVVAFVGIAVGLKSFLWSVGHVNELHDCDRRVGDPRRAQSSTWRDLEYR